MNGTAWYNEIDPVAAEWLRRLIAAGLIAPGVVDERDIRDVTPDELAGFIQCHFFAGIGIWSGALRASGWPDDRPIWTGSCPCQPFSAAGRGEGAADERHLWPHWLWHIEHRRPGVVLGEQVAEKDGLWWNDLVSADLGGTGYAFGSIIVCAAGFGMEWGRSAYAEWLERALHDCPDPLVARHLRNFAGWAREALGVGGLHIRHRQYFVGLADEPGRGWRECRDASLARAGRYPDGGGGPSGGLSDSECAERRPSAQRGDDESHGQDGGRDQASGGLGPHRQSGGLPDSASGRGRPGLRDRGPAGQRGPVAANDVPAGRLVNRERPRLEGLGGDGEPPDERGRDRGPGPGRSAAAAGEPGGLADDGRGGFQSGDRPGGELEPLGRDARAAGERQRGGHDDPAGGASGRLGDHRGGGRDPGEPGNTGTAESPGRECGHEPDRPSGPSGAGQADGRRSPFDWLLCRDGVWRAARPGTLPLAHAVAGRVGKLRAYGNGLDFETAVEVCGVAREIADEHGL